MQSRWLSPEVFEWEASVDFAAPADLSRFSRPHHLLEHAERKLASTGGDLDRADSVLTLKRAVNSRLQHIEELYGLASAFPKSIGALERLEAVDLARPLLTRQMFELRNEIEHNDGPVPDPLRCQELADATWYFLRATDAACSETPTSLEFRPISSLNPMPGAEYVSLHKLAPGLVNLTVTARLRGDQIASTAMPGYYELQSSPEYADSMRAMLRRSGMDDRHVTDEHYGPPDDRIEFGKLVYDNTFRIAMWRRLFACNRLRSAMVVHPDA